jgi:ribosome modulation factor
VDALEPPANSAVRAQLAQAWHEGAQAARQRATLDTCPYLPPTSSRERLLALWWIRGWHQAMAQIR